MIIPNEQILIFSVYTKTLKKLKEIIPNSRIVCGETPSTTKKPDSTRL